MPANDRQFAKMPALHEVNPNVSSQLSSAVMTAMEMREGDRFQLVGDFRSALQQMAGGQKTVVNPKTEKIKTGNKNNRALIYSVLGGLTIIILLFFVFVFWGSSSIEHKGTDKNKDIQETKNDLHAKSKKEVKENEKEQYILDLYNQLGGESKFGKFVDFRELIATDSSYQKDFFDTFGELTLGKFEDFKYMVTLELSPSTKENSNKENKESEDKVKIKNTHILPIMVQIPGKNYQMGKYEVTQEEWESVMGSNPSYFKACPRCPVENVSWNDVQDYIQKLNKLTGKKYRLPYEAEWEYAAKAGTNYTYAGSDNIDEVAWYSGGKSKTHVVGLKKPNNWGLYDMSGNVFEWCQDLEDSNRVLRGGSWRFGPKICIVSYHYSVVPDDRKSYLGFRLVLAP
jgi:hypothetical protein